MSSNDTSKIIVRGNNPPRRVSPAEIAQAKRSEWFVDLKDEHVFVDNEGRTARHDLTKEVYWVRIKDETGTVTDTYTAENNDAGKYSAISWVEFSTKKAGTSGEVWLIGRDTGIERVL
jgi:hypothetical protein